MAAAGAEQNPLISADGKSSVLLRDREDPGLHDDQLVDWKHPVGVATHHPGSVHPGLQDPCR